MLLLLKTTLLQQLRSSVYPGNVAIQSKFSASQTLDMMMSMNSKKQNGMSTHTDYKTDGIQLLLKLL